MKHIDYSNAFESEEIDHVIDTKLFSDPMVKTKALMHKEKLSVMGRLSR